MLKDALGSVMEAGRKSDAQSACDRRRQGQCGGRRDGGGGNRSRGLDAGLGARPVIQSYEDIMKMPI